MMPPFAGIPNHCQMEWDGYVFSDRHEETCIYSHCAYITLLDRILLKLSWRYA